MQGACFPRTPCVIPSYSAVELSWHVMSNTVSWISEGSPFIYSPFSPFFSSCMLCVHPPLFPSAPCIQVSQSFSCAPPPISGSVFCLCLFSVPPALTWLREKEEVKASFLSGFARNCKGCQIENRNSWIMLHCFHLGFVPCTKLCCGVCGSSC